VIRYDAAARLDARTKRMFEQEIVESRSAGTEWPDSDRTMRSLRR